jgi:hypothetical protein
LQLVVRDSDEWKSRYDEYKQAYKDRMGSIEIEYDTVRDGQPDTKVQNFAYVRQIR